MSQLGLIVCNTIAILVLVFALYFPRYRRKDMVVSILGVNVGVFSVATVLSESEVTAGLGLGLFGVLSIIRLRSQELDQEEVAYYFSALAIGLVAGVKVNPAWVTPALMAAIIGALFIGGHPKLFGNTRSQAMTLDTAYTDEAALRARLESLLGGQIHRMKVKRVDLVNDTTVVDVRFTVRSSSSSSEGLAKPGSSVDLQ